MFNNYYQILSEKNRRSMNRETTPLPGLADSGLRRLKFFYSVNHSPPNSYSGISFSPRTNHLMGDDAINADVKLVHEIFAFMSH